MLTRRDLEISSWLKKLLRKMVFAFNYIFRGKTAMSTVDERVKKIVVEQLGVKEEEASNEASFVDDLGADSLDTVELVMAFEEEFDMEIPDDQAETIATVGDAVKFLEKATAAAKKL